MEKVNEEEDSRERRRGKDRKAAGGRPLAQTRASRNFKRSNGPPTRNSSSSGCDAQSVQEARDFLRTVSPIVTTVECYDRYD